MKKILFICGKNKKRSPTAEAVFCNYADFDVRSAGVDNDAQIKLGVEDIEWADYIFVMERSHKSKIQSRFRKYIRDQRIISLGVPDIYEYMDDELVSILNDKVKRYFSL